MKLQHVATLNASALELFSHSCFRMRGPALDVISGFLEKLRLDVCVGVFLTPMPPATNLLNFLFIRFR